MPGVKKVVKLDEAVAVVADSYWRARTALAALKPEFTDAGHGGVSTRSRSSRRSTRRSARAPEMPADAAKVVTADYRVPFLAHATMEPMVCTAQVDGDRAEVWAGAQDPLNARSTAAKALGIAAENVHFTNFLLGGGFGRRLPFTFDYVDLGVRIAKAMSPAPVKTIWTRENDIQHDYYRGAGMARFAGALDAQRRAARRALELRRRRRRRIGVHAVCDRARRSARRAEAAHPIRLGPWRSVLNSQHGFFKESFIDEMAHAAGKDPFEFRRDLLGDQPRFSAALEKAAAMSGWGTPLPEGEGRGIALSRMLRHDRRRGRARRRVAGGQARVRHVCAAVDCGDVVNTDSAAAQAEGGIIFGLSAALVGEITIAEAAIVQRNFRDHQMIHLADAPI